MNPNNTPESDDGSAARKKNGGNGGHGKIISKKVGIGVAAICGFVALLTGLNIFKNDSAPDDENEKKQQTGNLREVDAARKKIMENTASYGTVEADKPYEPQPDEGMVGETAAPPQPLPPPPPAGIPIGRMEPIVLQPEAPPKPTKKELARQEIMNMRKKAFMAAMAAPSAAKYSSQSAKNISAKNVESASRHTDVSMNDAGSLLAPGKHNAQNTPAPGRDSGAYGEFGGDSSRWSLSERMQTPEMFTVQTGFVLPATLISGVNSDLAGQLIAQVSHNVYDTPTGKYLLIPQGTKLVGQYSANVQYGQERVLVAWQRLVFPDGRTLDLGSMPGADVSGYSGFEDQVNNHLWRLYRDAFLLSGIVGLVAYNQNKINERNSNNSSAANASSAFSEALGQELGSTSTKLIEKNMSISPTIEIRPGYRFNVVVTKDLVFDRPYTSFGR